MKFASIAVCLALLATPRAAPAADGPPEAGAGTAITSATTPAGPVSRSGRDIYDKFRAGLADKSCAGDGGTRWKAHFATAPTRLATRDDDLLPLFGYVVDALREASLPTEYALIPFVESGYKPGAVSKAGPAGLWQMIGITARHHKVPMRPGYDGRLSPIDSTRAAVRYLKTLHGMFAGDWRLAVMAYNAGEYRIFGALKRAGQTARNARPESLPGLSDITHAYVRKLRALSCLMEQADDRRPWLDAIDRPVPYLRAQTMPAGVRSLDALARHSGQDAGRLKRLNPALANGAVSGGVQVLLAGAAPEGAKAPVVVPPPVEPLGPLVDASTPLDAPTPAAEPLVVGPVVSTSAPRTHTVAKGDNAWTIARRHGVRVADLLSANDLSTGARLRIGQVLTIDAPTTR